MAYSVVKGWLVDRREWGRVILSKGVMFNYAIGPEQLEENRVDNGVEKLE
jgi:hypothetical protein